METFGKLVTAMILLVVSAIMRGFVLAKLWLWFMVTIFKLPAIRTIEAIGLMLIIGFIMAQNKDSKNEKSFGEALLSSTVFLITICGLFLLFGWMVYKIML